MKKSIPFLLSLSALIWVSCGGGETPPTPPAVTISISPTTATVEVTETAQFTATVRNTTNTTVTWQVNGINGGDSTVGTINSSGLYTAPSTVPSPADVTVTAISQADTTKSATATVTIKLRITVTPASVSVLTASSQQFVATVEGVTNTDVEWQVNGVPGGNATVGTIDATGLYTAPAAIPSPSTVTVTAVAQADTSQSDSASVTVVEIVVTVSPTAGTVEIQNTIQFTATVENTPNTTVIWRVNDIDGGNATFGTITATGLYTAPASVPNPATVTVKAVSQADTTKSGSATVTIKLRITVTPADVTVPAAGTQQFDALVEGVANTSVTWQVNGVTGGNASVGTISATGLYTAPLAIPAGGTVTVAAVAQADTSKSDSVDVTLVHSLAMLNGQYAFAFWGFDTDGLIYTAGSIIADGNGLITGGVMDLNTFAGVFANLGLTGTYTVTDDGRVEFLLTDTDAFSYTFRAVIISPNRLHMLQFDTFAAGQGYIDKQDPTAFNDAAFTGGYALGFEGISTNGIEMFAGRMTADGAGGISAGVMDINDAGDDTRSAAFTGSYAIAANGRGTVTLNTGAAMGTLTFAVYVVSDSKAYFVSLDFVPAFVGTAAAQTLGSFSTANLTGDYVFNAAGFSTTGFFYNVGRFTANGAGTTSAGVADENDAGVVVENLAFTGTYSIAANGRGTAAFTSTRGTSNYSFYMVSPTRAFFVQHGVAVVSSGDVDAQQGGPFSNASIAGSYGLSMDGDPTSLVGQLDAGNGAATGIVDVTVYDSTNNVYVPAPDQTFDASYSVTANGRGNFTVADTPPIVFHTYVVSPSKVYLIGVSDVLLGPAEKRY